MVSVLINEHFARLVSMSAKCRPFFDTFQIFQENSSQKEQKLNFASVFVLFCRFTSVFCPHMSKNHRDRANDDRSEEQR